MNEYAPLIDFDAEVCVDFSRSSRLEWLVTNGIGGFAMGTVAGILTRRYHGILIAALSPPVGRTLLIPKIDETLETGGIRTPLFGDRKTDGSITPRGYESLIRFRLEKSIPVWTFQIGTIIIEKRIWMEQGANTTYIHYEMIEGTAADLHVDVLANRRDYHDVTTGKPRIDTEVDKGSLRMEHKEKGPVVRMLASGGDWEALSKHVSDYFLCVEEYRGLREREDHLKAGRIRIPIEPGRPVTLVATIDPGASKDGEKGLERRRNHDSNILRAAASTIGGSPLAPQLGQLALAADQFIVDRTGADDPNGRSVIAGYPWFSDWGRDTMISLSGIALCTGRSDVAKKVLETFGRHVSEGMIPNRFPDLGEEPEYNTVDGTLWYFEAIASYLDATEDLDLLSSLWPTLKEIVDAHFRGTRHNIHVDPNDGLLHSGEAGVQLTWMDAKVEDWVVTPRIGKPVEINALWFNALRTMGDFAAPLGESPAPYDEAAAEVRESFVRYWNNDSGCLFDVIDGPDRDDPAIRPNQIFAVSLPHSPLDGNMQSAVVDVCQRDLLTPHGLRSLSPRDPAYIGRYGGDRRTRDAAYHQGTVWGWLLGPFAVAHLRVNGDPELARSFFMPLIGNLHEHGLGSVSEIFDGDAPFTPRGCTAQAWSVAEILRAWKMTARD